MRFPFVLLDAGETLIGPRDSFGAVYARVLAGLGVAADAREMERSLRETWDGLNREIPPGHDRYAHFEGGESGYWIRFVERTLAGAGTDATDLPSLARRALEPLRDAFRDPGAWTVYPEVPPVLDRLRGAGARIAVVSNWDSRLPALLDGLGLGSRLDAVVVSHLEGVEKPDPEIFRRACDRLGATPGRTLHVGDLPELDLEGARRAGVAGVLVDRRARLDPSWDALPDLAAVPDLATGERPLPGEIRTGPA